MRTATVSEAKNSLSALLDLVRNGETVLVTDRGRPVARLAPVSSPEDAGPDEGRLARLERSGVVRRTARIKLDEIARTLPPAPSAGADVLEALLEERRGDR